MTRTPRLPVVFVLVLLAALGACRSAVVENAPEAPPLSTEGFVSLGPSDAPLRAQNATDPRAPLECDGPMLAVVGQPDDAGLAAAQAQGYRTIVNFRSPDEEGYVDQKAAVEVLGMRYVEIPVKGRDVTAAHADALAVVLADPASGPVLLHCRTGSRAAMVWTAWLARHGGLSVDDAPRYGERAGVTGDKKAAVEKALQ